MTREELVGELNKIDGVHSFVYEKNNVLIYVDLYPHALCYVWPRKALYSLDFFNGEHLLGFERTPEKILSVVKALVE